MKKKIIAGVLAVATAISMAGCGNTGSTDSASTDETPQLVAEPIGGDTQDTGTDTTEPEGTPAEDTTEDTTAEVTDEEVINYITDRPEVDGKKQSYLTGEWKDVDVVNRRPMAVMMPNNSAAQPLYGISKASIIYEAPMEWLSCTRLMAVYEDYDELDHIGPVRSARAYFVWEAMSIDAIFCNWGLAVPYVGPIINTDRVDNVSAAVYGIDDPSDEAFARDTDRQNAGYATEYTGIMTISGYESAVERHGYETTYRDRFEQTFLFAKDGYTQTYDDNNNWKVSLISPGGSTSANSGGGYGHATPYFVYNEEDNLFHRYQFGEEMVDSYNNEPIAVNNVIFKIVNGEYVDDHGYLSFNVNGEGSAYVFTNGRLITASWVKDGEQDSDPTRYYDINGDEIILDQGKTWVCLVWSDYANFIEIQRAE